MALYPVRVNPVLLHPEERRISLRGDWQFCLDPEDCGVAERWFAHPDRLTETIAVPGSWQGQGFGTDAKDMVWDFRVEARTFRATYTGTGWYGKAIAIPEEWAGQRIWLNFGGAHPSAEVWLDGQRLGDNSMPFVPFGFEITNLVQPGKEYWLAVRVSEEARIYGFAFSWQGNWSGLYRDVELTATGDSYIDMCWLDADVDKRHLRIHANIGGQRGATARITARPLTGAVEPIYREIEIGGGIDLRLPVPSPLLWSPDSPHLYQVDIEILRDGKVLDALSERTGFVKLSTGGKHFCINDEPYYMRGTGDFISCPETGCPDTDRERWRRKLQALRDYGYNYVRCQSYVYGPEYYDVADEVGLLVQSEMGLLGGWGSNTQWHVYSWPPPSPEYRPRLREQWNAVVRRDVNHPSANMYCMSNELGGGTLYPRAAWQCYHETKAIKPTALVIYTDGGYSPDLPCDFANAEASDVEATCDKPLIQHEFRWWSSFPDVGLMDKYSGAVRPYAAEIARQCAEEHGIAHVLAQGAEMSKRLQFLEAKGKMEMCRRDNPRMAGICHFDAMDANPSPQGIITEFYERKYADAPTWRQTNGDTIVMSSLQFDDRCLTAGETLKCAFTVSDFAHPPFAAPVIRWQLVADNAVLASGETPYQHQPFVTCPAGEIAVTIPAVEHPQPAVLQAELREGDRVVTNQWSLWLLPGETVAGAAIYGTPEYTWAKTLNLRTAATPEGVVISEVLDETLAGFIREGGRVILAAGEGLVKPYNPKFGFTLGQYYFTPPANYPPYEDGHDGTIIQDHPLFGNFPHEGFADLQFFRLMDKAPSMPLEPLGLNAADPVIRVMHSYPVGRSLGYLVDAAYGQGRLIICALDLNQEWPEARALLNRVIAYAAGNSFRPGVALSEEAMQTIMQATQIP